MDSVSEPFQSIRMPPRAALWTTLALLSLIGASRFAEGQEAAPAPSDSRQATDVDRDRLNDVVRRAFREASGGWSSDEVLVRDDLNQAFIRACQRELPDVPERDFNWTMLNLRKAGKLETIATLSNNQSYDGVLHVAEIAARSLQDKYEISTDAIMADPERREEFDGIALAVDSSIDPYQVRKCALRLRKARQLRPELITRIADWNREVLEFSAEEVQSDLERIPERPGIYLFRDRSGYLYIGEALNLRDRLKTHLDDSDRKSLAHYLEQQGAASISIEIHSFPADSRMSELRVRRAYESELIRSRKPRFNVRP